MFCSAEVSEAPVAQLTSVLDFKFKGRGLESYKGVEVYFFEKIL